MSRVLEDGSRQRSGAVVTETGRFATGAVEFVASRSEGDAQTKRVLRGCRLSQKAIRKCQKKKPKTAIPYIVHK